MRVWQPRQRHTTCFRLNQRATLVWMRPPVIRPTGRLPTAVAPSRCRQQLPAAYPDPRATCRLQPCRGLRPAGCQCAHTAPPHTGRGDPRRAYRPTSPTGLRLRERAPLGVHPGGDPLHQQPVPAVGQQHSCGRNGVLDPLCGDGTTALLGPDGNLYGTGKSAGAAALGVRSRHALQVMYAIQQTPSSSTNSPLMTSMRMARCQTRRANPRSSGART
jgi:hypothetical protein